MGEGASRPTERQAAERRRRVVGAVVSAGLIAVTVILAFVGGSGGGEETASGAGARIVSSADLTAALEEVGHDIYWAGERPPAQLELKEEPEGSVYLRYLPPGVEVGEREAAFLTVGSYPIADAFSATRNAAKADGAKLRHLPGGAIAFDNPQSEGSVYLAYPGSDVQVEVYDPTPGASMELVMSGVIRPVGE
jgi:hypothetical protein